MPIDRPGSNPPERFTARVPKRRVKIQFNVADLMDEVDIIDSINPGSVSMTIRDWMGDTASLTLSQPHLKEFIRVLQRYVED